MGWLVVGIVVGFAMGGDEWDWLLDCSAVVGVGVAVGEVVTVGLGVGVTVGVGVGVSLATGS